MASPQKLIPAFLLAAAISVGLLSGCNGTDAESTGISADSASISTQTEYAADLLEAFSEEAILAETDFSETEQPETEPPETVPSETTSPVTTPPETAPPATESPAPEPDTTIVFLSWPVTISRNHDATVEVQGAPNTEYSITVLYKSGPSTAKGLETKTSDDNGYVSWTWHVGSRTSTGTFTVTVTGGGESETVDFSIE